MKAVPQVIDDHGRVDGQEPKYPCKASEAFFSFVGVLGSCCGDGRTVLMGNVGRGSGSLAVGLPRRRLNLFHL